MLRAKLQDDLTQSLKNKETEKLSLLRFVVARVKNQEIEKKAELTDDETVVILKKIDRELHESLDAAQKANREDLIAQNTRQIELLAPYLPPEMTDEVLTREIKEIIAQNQDAITKNPKAIIGICMNRLKGKADSSRIMSTLRALSPGV